MFHIRAFFGCNYFAKSSIFSIYFKTCYVFKIKYTAKETKMSDTASGTTASKSVHFVLMPRFNMATLATMIEPLRIANYVTTNELYSWSFLTPAGGQIKASNMMEVACHNLDYSDSHAPNYIALLGSWGAERHSDDKLASWLRGKERHGVPLIGVEIGSYILARAGLLTNREATTHWSFFAGFAENFPNIDAREQMFTIDNKVMTCAGGMAGIDLMLHLISTAHGEELANEVANQMLHQFRYEDHFPQRPHSNTAVHDVHPTIRKVTHFLEERIEENITIPELCEKLDMPQRKLERLFNKHVGCTVVQFYRFLKLQYARTLLVSTTMDIREISVASGFNSMSYFSHCFSKTFGRKPSHYRMAWPEAENSPSWPGTMYALTKASKAYRANKAPITRQHLPDAG
jgi:AraC family carnitine catabolism transcriptional activator